MNLPDFTPALFIVLLFHFAANYALKFKQYKAFLIFALSCIASVWLCSVSDLIIYSLVLAVDICLLVRRVLKESEF